MYWVAPLAMIKWIWISWWKFIYYWWLLFSEILDALVQVEVISFDELNLDEYFQTRFVLTAQRLVFRSMKAERKSYFLIFTAYCTVSDFSFSYTEFKCEWPRTLTIDWVKDSAPISYELFGLTRDQDCALTEDMETERFYCRGDIYFYLKWNMDG